MVKNSSPNARDIKDVGLIPSLGRSPEGRNGNPFFLPGKFHEQRSLVTYSHMTETTAHTLARIFIILPLKVSEMLNK